MKKPFSILCVLFACTMFANSVTAHTDNHRTDNTPKQKGSTTEVVKLHRQYNNGAFTIIEFVHGADGIISNAKFNISRHVDNQADSELIYLQAAFEITHSDKEVQISYADETITITFNQEIKDCSVDIVNGRIIDEVLFLADDIQMPKLTPKK